MKKKGLEEEKEADLAAQFPEIERLLEEENFDGINRGFSAAYEELEKISKAKGGLGKSAKSHEARRAMKAIERVMDLLRDLLKMKYETGTGVSGPHGKK